MTAIVDDLMRDEGVKLKPYRDTEGNLTIGIGRNLDATGISADEAADMLLNDITATKRFLDDKLPWWVTLSANRQRGLLNMAFNLREKLLEFEHMLAALRAGDNDAAAFEALNSEWARQVGDRAVRIATLFRNG